MSSRNRSTRWFFLVAPLLLSLANTSQAQTEPTRDDTGVAGLGLALRRLQTTASVLFVTAHPDDENNAILAYLSRGLGMRVGILTLTRGAGGQNEIGPELGDALGVVRSGELLAVHRHDKVEQLFGSVVDFGYSFSVEETLLKWDREKTLADIVRVYRAFRPDAVVTMIPDGAGGGQHHQTSARLAELALDAAGDPERFRDQIAAGLRPWRPTELYRAPFRLRDEDRDAAWRVPVGRFDMLLGKTYAEFGALARNEHRCQGMNTPPRLGSPEAWLLQVAPPSNGLLTRETPPGLTLLSKVAALGEMAALAQRARAAYLRSDFALVSAAVMAGLDQARQALRQAHEMPPDAGAELVFLLERELEDWLEAAVVAQQIAVTAIVVRSTDAASGRVDGVVTPGEVFELETVVAKRSDDAVDVSRVEVNVPDGWDVETLEQSDGPVRSERAYRWRHRIRVSSRALPRPPFWYRSDAAQGRYSHRAQVSRFGPVAVARPFLPDVVGVSVQFRAHGVSAVYSRPAVHRWYDAASGLHRSHAVKVARGLSLTPLERRLLLPVRSTQRRAVGVRVRNDFPRPVTAHVRLEVPPVWGEAPSEQRLELADEGAEATLEFELPSAARQASGRYALRCVARVGGRDIDDGYDSIAYHHIETRHHYAAAEVEVIVDDIAIEPNLHVGYVMGVGDAVPTTLRALGASVKLLEEDDLAGGDLSSFDAIVLGIRAYKDRVDLRANQQRLMEYVHDGGHLVVQYNKYEFRSDYAPYPATIHRPHDRVTDENAVARLLDPDHAIFQRPNSLTTDDWAGWVQERGLYFWGEWDTRYTPLLEFSDPFPYNSGAKRGGLVVCRYGKGTYAYTGLAFFRQLPAGVTGACRLFANIVSWGRTRDR